jgi:hypothetical protein
MNESSAAAGCNIDERTDAAENIQEKEEEDGYGYELKRVSGGKN